MNKCAHVCNVAARVCDIARMLLLTIHVYLTIIL